MSWPSEACSQATARRRAVACGGFECREHLVDVELAGGAGFGQGFAPAAAVVDAEALEDANRRGLFEGNFANGLCKGNHDDLLNSP